MGTSCAQRNRNATINQFIYARLLSEDTAASARISAALTNDTQSAYFKGVRVETFKGIVQLSGFVNTGALKNRAGDIARETAGGREVKNSIAVKQ